MAQNKSFKELMALQGQAGAQNGAQTSNQMLDLILNRKPFQYDQKNDPAAQAARKTAALNARAVTQNTLGQHAAMTGGMPSTAAVSAAAQAGNTALQEGADKVAELQELAYQRYRNEGQDMYNAFAAMQGAEGDAWNRNMQEQQWAYQKEQDAYQREQEQKQWEYGLQQDAQARAEAEYQKELALAQLKAAYGDYSGLKALGVDTSKYAAGGGYGGSGGGGGYRGSGGGSGGGPGSGGGGDDNGNNAALAALLTAYPGKVLTASEWAAAAAQYGEQFLIDNGFSKKKASLGHSGNTGGAARKEKPGSVGGNQMDMMI